MMSIIKSSLVNFVCIFFLCQNWLANHWFTHLVFIPTIYDLGLRGINNLSYLLYVNYLLHGLVYQ